MKSTCLLVLSLVLCPAVATYAEEVELMAEDAPEQAPAETVTESAGAPTEEESSEPDAAELAQRAAELNRELREVETQLRQQRGQSRRAATSELDEIVLPDNPTREDYTAYIDAIDEATQGQNSFSSNDPQVEMLSQIPPEHVDLLVGRVGSRSSLRFHAQYALRGMDLSVLRERINALVLDQPAMIGIVVSYGWSQDAREAITAKLKQEPPNLGIAWFQAAAELNDPSLYDAMHRSALQTRYGMQVLEVLECLPDYDLDRTVAEMWARANDGSNTHNLYQIAQSAAAYGHVDALGVLISQLARRSSFHSSNGENTYDSQRASIMRYIDFAGTAEEIAEWFELHKDELIFDHVTQRYLLPEQLERFEP